MVAGWTCKSVEAIGENSEPKSDLFRETVIIVHDCLPGSCPDTK